MSKKQRKEPLPEIVNIFYSHPYNGELYQMELFVKSEPNEDGAYLLHHFKTGHYMAGRHFSEWLDGYANQMQVQDHIKKQIEQL